MKSNVLQAVPFFRVTNMAESLRWYTAVGFELTKSWAPQGSVRWCWLQNGGAALMLQDYRRDDGSDVRPEGKLGEGVSICFVCDDALAIYRDVTAKGIDAARPFVGNGMWVTMLIDPDGYRVEFESETDVPEESVYGGG